MRQAHGNTAQKMLVRMKVSFKMDNFYLLAMTTCATDADAVILVKKSN